MTSDLSHEKLRTIKTARTEDEINKGARDGFYPLVKKVVPSDKIKSKYAIRQNKETGEIDVYGDARAHIAGLMDQVIDFTYYYPHQFPSPFAAYLVPPDIKVGETVFLEDLIQDLVGGRWNQGDTYRLNSCTAKWNGKDFEIQHEEPDSFTFVG